MVGLQLRLVSVLVGAFGLAQCAECSQTKAGILIELAQPWLGLQSARVQPSQLGTLELEQVTRAGILIGLAQPWLGLRPSPGFPAQPSLPEVRRLQQVRTPPLI